MISAAVVLTMLCCTGLLAQPPLTITTSGYYLTQVDASGVPTMIQITTVIDLTDGKNPPQPPPPDVVDIDKALVKSVKSWATEAGETMTAQALAAVYSHVRGAVEDDILTVETIWPVLNEASDFAVECSEGTQWKPFRDKLSDHITEARQRGTLQNKVDVLRLALSVQQGLELSADGSDALSLDKLTAIAAKTNEIIDANR